MITKKSYITGITIVILTSSALAEDRTGFYLKGNVGVNKFGSAKERNHPIQSNKSKAKISPSFFNLGIGFYSNNYLRHDLSIGYQKVNFENSNIEFNLREDDKILVGTSVVNRKTNIYSAMINSYVDLPVTSKAIVFFGGGIGIARIKEKISQAWAGAVLENNTVIDSINDKSYGKNKNKINFAYSLITGISLKLSDKANFELSYSWSHFGKPSHKNNTYTNNKYNGHSIMTGIRFDI